MDRTLAAFKGREMRVRLPLRAPQNFLKKYLTNSLKGDIIKVQKGEKSNSQTQLKLGCPLPK